MSDLDIVGGGRPAPTEPTSYLTPVAAATMPIGTPVYIDASGDGNKARSNAGGTTACVGLLARPVVSGDRTLVQTRGVLTMTDADWKAVNTGAASLVAGTKYYLSAAAAGVITSTAPTAGGDFVIPIGVALSVTQMDLAPQPQFGAAISGP